MKGTPWAGTPTRFEKLIARRRQTSSASAMEICDLDPRIRASSTWSLGTARFMRCLTRLMQRFSVTWEIRAMEELSTATASSPSPPAANLLPRLGILLVAGLAVLPAGCGGPVSSLVRQLKDADPSVRV